MLSPRCGNGNGGAAKIAVEGRGRNRSAFSVSNGRNTALSFRILDKKEPSWTVGCSVPHDIITPNYTGTDAAKIVLIRDIQFYGGGVRMYLELDDIVVCGLKTGQYTEFLLSPGKHVLQVTTYNEYGNKLVVDFEPRQTYYFSAKSKMFSTVLLERIDEEEALKKTDPKKGYKYVPIEKANK